MGTDIIDWHDWEKDENEFKNLDLKKTIKEIYKTSLQKADDNYLKEIALNRVNFLETTYTEEQAQEKFSNYAAQIRVDFENDDCVYRIIRKEVHKAFQGESYEIQVETIEDMICLHINEYINNYSQKLSFIHMLPQQIYISNKTHRQFLFFKELANNQTQKEEKPKDTKKPTIVNYALYYIYLQKSGDAEHFENHPKGKLKAIEELIENGEIKTTTNYFQKIYNELHHHDTNRIARNQVSNIEYTANNMLTDYPKAQKIALTELKIAQVKKR